MPMKEVQLDWDSPGGRRGFTQCLLEVLSVLCPALIMAGVGGLLTIPIMFDLPSFEATYAVFCIIYSLSCFLPILPPLAFSGRMEPEKFKRFLKYTVAFLIPWSILNLISELARVDAMNLNTVANLFLGMVLLALFNRSLKNGAGKPIPPIVFRLCMVVLVLQVIAFGAVYFLVIPLWFHSTPFNKALVRLTISPIVWFLVYGLTFYSLSRMPEAEGDGRHVLLFIFPRAFDSTMGRLMVGPAVEPVTTLVLVILLALGDTILRMSYRTRRRLTRKLVQRMSGKSTKGSENLQTVSGDGEPSAAEELYVSLTSLEIVVELLGVVVMTLLRMGTGPVPLTDFWIGLLSLVLELGGAILLLYWWDREGMPVWAFQPRRFGWRVVTYAASMAFIIAMVVVVAGKFVSIQFEEGG